MKVRLQNGMTFDAVQWTGTRDGLPDWLAHNRTEHDRFHGMLLSVGYYLVKPQSWVLKSERGDVFPVPAELMWDNYAPVPEVEAVAPALEVRAA